MTLEVMTELSKDHFLANLATDIEKMIVLHHYANEELALPKEEIGEFIMKAKIGDRDDTTGDEDRFFTWYFLNYVLQEQTEIPFFHFKKS